MSNTFLSPFHIPIIHNPEEPQSSLNDYPVRQPTCSRAKETRVEYTCLLEPALPVTDNRHLSFIHPYSSTKTSLCIYNIVCY